MDQKTTQITVKALIVKDKSIFMLKDHSGNWELPGGRVLYGESPKNALKREFEEELGLNNIKIGKLLDVWDFISEKTGNHFVVIVYLCEADFEKLNISKEHSQHDWVSSDKVHLFPMREGYLKLIKEYGK